MDKFFLLLLPATVNPELFAAVMVMLLSTNAKRLMVGYLIGAYTSSIGVGLVIVFALPGSTATSTAKNTVNPAIDLALGVIALIIALALGTGPHERARRHSGKSDRDQKPKETPRWRRALDQGSPRTSFAVGAVLSLPGASYLVALDILHRQNLGSLATVALVIVFCLISLVLIEVPLLGYTFAPDSTVRAVQSFQAWIGRNARKIATVAALVIGVFLVVRGGIEFLS